VVRVEWLGGRHAAHERHAYERPLLRHRPCQFPAVDIRKSQFGQQYIDPEVFPQHAERRFAAGHDHGVASQLGQLSIDGKT